MRSCLYKVYSHLHELCLKLSDCSGIAPVNLLQHGMDLGAGNDTLQDQKSKFECSRGHAMQGIT